MGGWSGPYGGTGGPPGGFIGYLPQTRVAYDETESEDCNIPSGVTPSLLHNLNRIRCRIKDIETSLSTGSGVGVNIVNTVPENASTKDYYGIVYWSGTQDPYKFRAIKQVFGPLEIKTDWNDGIYDHTGFITIGSRAVEFIRDPYPNLPSGESLILREISYGGLYGKEYQLKKLISTDSSILISGTSDGYIDLRVISGGSGGGDSIDNANYFADGLIYINGTNNPQLLRGLLAGDYTIVSQGPDDILIDTIDVVVGANNINEPGPFDSYDIDPRGGNNLTLQFRYFDNYDGHLNIYLNSSAIVIDNFDLVESLVDSLGSVGFSIIESGSGPNPALKKVKPGNNITIQDNGNELVISSICPEFIVEEYTISGNIYTLQNEPSGAVQVFIDQIVQRPSTYTVSGSNVIFNSTPVGSYILFYYITCAAQQSIAGYGLDEYGLSSYGGI